jgi:hypothetical protein
MCCHTTRLIFSDVLRNALLLGNPMCDGRPECAQVIRYFCLSPLSVFFGGDQEYAVLGKPHVNRHSRLLHLEKKISGQAGGLPVSCLRLITPRCSLALEKSPMNSPYQPQGSALIPYIPLTLNPLPLHPSAFYITHACVFIHACLAGHPAPHSHCTCTCTRPSPAVLGFSLHRNYLSSTQKQAS